MEEGLIIKIYFIQCVIQTLTLFYRVTASFGLNTGKYGPEITPYLDTFHAVGIFGNYQRLPERKLCDVVEIWNS